MLCALGEETDSGASTPSTVVMSPDPELDLDGEGVDMAEEFFKCVVKRRPEQADLDAIAWVVVSRPDTIDRACRNYHLAGMKMTRAQARIAVMESQATDRTMEIVDLKLQIELLQDYKRRWEQAEARDRALSYMPPPVDTMSMRTRRALERTIRTLTNQVKSKEALIVGLRRQATRLAAAEKKVAELTNTLKGCSCQAKDTEVVSKPGQIIVVPDDGECEAAVPSSRPLAGVKQRVRLRKLMAAVKDKEAPAGPSLAAIRLAEFRKERDEKKAKTDKKM